MRILFIEDDAMNRKVVSEMLSAADVELIEAESGPEGLRMINEQDFSLVLLDLRMPGMDGFEVLEAIRGRDDKKASSVVIVVTAAVGFVVDVG